MRKYLLIGSEQPGYAKRLARSLENKESCALLAEAFETPEELASFCGKHPTAVVLSDESWVETGRLTELPGRPGMLTLTDQAENNRMEHQIYRYQSVDEMLRKLIRFCGEAVIAGPSPSGGKSIRLTAVYSPGFPALKTAFAMTLAAMEKRFHKTLYLNLEEFGGSGILLKGNGGKNLGDAVYYLKQDELDGGLLSSMIVTSGSVDFIPSMPFADDVREVTGEEWVRLLTRIAEISDYEELVVDLPQSLYVASDVLDACDEFFLPMGEDSISRARMRELETYMERPEHRRLQEKMKKVRIYGGNFPDSEDSADYPEELLYGSFGEEVLREVPVERK